MKNEHENNSQHQSNKKHNENLLTLTHLYKLHNNYVAVKIFHTINTKNLRVPFWVKAPFTLS